MSDVRAVMNLQVEEPRLLLPPGFRFHPTDSEVVVDYLTPKALNSSFSCVVMADVDLNKVEPWDLPGKAKMGEKEWFFFVHKDRKYPTGTRTNRATASGYWKATGKDKEIYRMKKTLVGMKKTLVFYTGRAPRGEKTPWVMHEYRLEGKLPPNLPAAAKDEWAVCRVFNKDLAAKGAQMAPPADVVEPPSIGYDDFLDDILQPPPLMDSPFAVEDLLCPAAGVKAEQQNQVESFQDPKYYFSLPAGPSNPGGDYQQAAAIRAECNTMAPASPYPELEDLLADDGYIDYSSMLK